MPLKIKPLGEATLPVLVLLHGWGMHTAVWGAFAKALAKYFHVLCIDLPGHGQSADVQATTLADVVDAIAGHLPKGKVHMLGWSYGGVVAVEYAQRYPEQCASLFLLGFNPCFVQTVDWPGADLKTLRAFEKSLEKNVAITLKRFAALVCLGGQDEKQMARQLWQLLCLEAIPTAETLQQHLALLIQSDVRSTLQKLSVPASLLFFAKDQLVPVQCSAYVNALNPQLNIQQLGGAGHYPFLTHKEKIIGIIRDRVSNE